MTEAIKLPDQNIDNRLSEMQAAIVAYLETFPGPIGDRIGHLPRTGDVVDAIGFPRTKAAFASVSRSLSRLAQAGKVSAYSPSISTRGNGVHWCLRRDA